MFLKAASCKCSYVLSFSLTFDCDNVSIVLENGILGEIGITKLAKQKQSDGFSYSHRGICKLCTMDQLETLQTEKYWGVYERIGNSNVCHIKLEFLISRLTPPP